MCYLGSAAWRPRFACVDLLDAGLAMHYGGMCRLGTRLQAGANAIEPRMLRWNSGIGSYA